MKVCEIINGEFSWVLKVDGRSINFQGYNNAFYFASHYVELGYKVTFEGSEIITADEALKDLV